MTALAAFATVLLVAALGSARANRTVLSSAVLFLIAGFLSGSEVFGLVAVGTDSDAVSTLAELALVAVLFTDGMRVGIDDLRSAWRLPGRALLVGMPLTMGLTTVFAHLVTGTTWAESLLLGAVLAPTDPVLARAIVGRAGIPPRLGRLLNVESGLNDGLALPVVIILLSTLTGAEVSLVGLLGEIGLGLALGVVVPAAALALERLPFLSTADDYQPFTALAIGLLVFSTARLTGANEFLAMFAAGVTIASLAEAARESFNRFGELAAEVLKLAALMVFGAFISPSFLAEIPWTGYLFAALVLVVSRPIAMAVAFARSGLPRRVWVAAAWFGPKGFASVVYGLLILDAGISAGDELFHLVALVVIASVLVHSSSDVMVARWLTDESEDLDASEDGASEDGAPDGGASASPVSEHEAEPTPQLGNPAGKTD